MPGPSFPEVLFEIRNSKREVLAVVEKTEEAVARIDIRVESLEHDRLQRTTQRSTVLSMISHSKTVVGALIGAIVAVAGTGFLGI